VNKFGNIDNFLVNCRFAKLTDKAKALRVKIKRKLIKSGTINEIQIVKEKRVKATAKAE
jgi:hypothetical protein